MSPIDPSNEPLDLTPAPATPAPVPPPLEPSPLLPEPPPPREPFWDYTDLLLFVFLLFASLALALVVGIILFSKLNPAFRLLLPQILWYVLAFSALKVLLLIRYGRPFWSSLGWRSIPIPAALGALFMGPVLAISVSLLGAALRTPPIELPFQQMLGAPGANVLLGILVVILGPAAEELAFRGFLMPLLIRSLGASAGIILTGFIFGSIHGYEYEWSWRYMLLISLVGCVLGWAKYRTKSTAASALMHSTFNLTQFAAFLWQSRAL
ncbi:MAG TPA: type II CAAX endopeptidase family protein [Bryobacteraceae bacterium]|nr:type II CAAX endopeptidase family protein [Bryobacteraceae bacterium]